MCIRAWLLPSVRCRWPRRVQMNFAGRDLSILSLRKVHVIISSLAAGLQPVTAQQGIKDFQIRVDIASRQQPAGYILFSTALTEPEDVHGQRSEYSQIQSRQPSKPSQILQAPVNTSHHPFKAVRNQAPFNDAGGKPLGWQGCLGLVRPTARCACTCMHAWA